ncbi:DUF1853 family protein [Antarcticibacterium flavum]|uniref:DUF1853 family protein n=1 Tax=Antarcticibacterium flavum TaxID=2058175 RepID=A0A5B7X0U0_9FLAO|nr:MULTISPECIES: DUF1853 family protein [Antarcticibacterium]MCM4158961.1 DUF1853 domain-containing protein [Antarcticibacterium sp. W02-3]QCY68213.1 DUF1853 family protein [Antarcticibacterium flavum]
MENREWFQFLGFLSTPPLWLENEVFNLDQFTLPPVEFNRPSNLKEEIPSLESNFVLGKRIESFYSLVLQKSKPYSIIAQGMQIFSDKITLGELDFLLQKTGKEEVIHLEVVYKFYIYDPNINGELEKWIGPNRKDTLLKKLNKLEQKQLPLLYREETLRATAALDIAGKAVKQQVSFLAHLFLPKDLQQRDVPCINPECLSGTWIHKSDFTKEDYGDCKFFIPLKQDWPIDPSKNDTWHSFQEIMPQVQRSLEAKKSPLIWMNDKSGIFERFFIVWWSK